MNVYRQTSWYQRMFGETLDSFSSGLKKQVHIDYVFRDLKKQIEMGVNVVIGVYFSPLDSLSNERTNQLAQLFHAINGKYSIEKDVSKANNSETQTSWSLEIIQVVLANSAHWLDRCTIDVELLNQRLIGLPWYAVPASDRDRLLRLTRRFDVKTLSPLLVLLEGATGEIITKHGLEALARDAIGAAFPWKPRSLPQLLNGVPLHQYQQQQAISTIAPLRHQRCLNELNATYFGFYFGAHWCPPCRCFTPQLMRFYEKVKSRGIAFEVIFVSSDRSNESYEEEARAMPWLSVPWEEKDIRQELAALFAVHGIPSLVITDASGHIITADGRGELNEDLEAKRFPWIPRLVNILTDRLASRLQDNPALVLFLEEEDRVEIENAVRMLTTVAEEISNHANESLPLDFFVANDVDTSDGLRDFVGLDDSVPLLAIINIPEGTWSSLEDGTEITKETVQNMVSRFLSNQLNKLPIGGH